tara:strand:- start:13143 stop:14393 length:1251 start_codon:yes stop_codon:yes gene_type:complete
MRNNNQISKEPSIKVGIILPNDNMSQIDIVLSDCDSFELETLEKIFPSCKNKNNLSIINNNGSLILKELECHSKNITIRPITSSKNTFITLKNITAGRGFHWQKKIDVKYWGDIHFRIAEDKLIAINEVNLEDYLKCVATSEMSQDCPNEFLIAQTIVARSWILANAEQKHSSLNFDVCNDDCCQRYHGLNNCTPKSIEAADNSYGKVLTYKNEICDTRYSKSCGGITENFENVWENKSIPYLKSIKDCNDRKEDYCNPNYFKEISISNYIGSVDEDSEYYRWKFEVDTAYVIKHLKLKYKIEAEKIIDLQIMKVGLSGRAYQLNVLYRNKTNNEKNVIINTEYHIRDLLSESFLYSSAFTITKEKEKYILYGKGWGHGVGLCQIGALGMSFLNKDSLQILGHYFPKTEVKKIYNS